MTVRELCALEGVSLCYFDGERMAQPRLLQSSIKGSRLDINLSEKTKSKVALHELGQKNTLLSIRIEQGALRIAS